MLYELITIKEKEYKLRLTARACVDLEKKLGMNPLNIFMHEGAIPPLSQLLVVFHASLQEYNHGITMDDTYKLYDDFCEDGGDIAKFVNVIIDVFTAAGFIPKSTEETEKNV